MSYTKGDWKVKYEGEVGRAGSRIYVVGEDGFGIARIADKEEREANAHLVAAAPDMYEALKQAQVELSGYYSKLKRRLTSLEEARISMINKALAKANGQIGG